MSFKIGQLRKNQLSYPNDYQIEKDVKGTASTTLSINGFNEGAFPYSFEEGKTYYINLSTTLSESLGTPTRYIKLYSKGQDGKEGKEMTIKKLSSSSYSDSQEIIFTPNRNYDYLIVQIDRKEISSSQSNAYYKIEFKKLWELKNILTVANFKNKFPNIKTIKSLGIQGPIGMIFALNGEEFKIGKSGVYTISDVEIDSICFFLKTVDSNSNRFPFYTGETQEFFIMDFEY